MKSNSIILTVLVAIIAISTISCSKNKCKTITCANGGVCNSGICTCATGYEGANCETLSRDKFFGNWSVFEPAGISDAGQFDLSIVESGNQANTLSIINMHNLLPPVSAYVIGDNIFIPNQKVGIYTVFGAGVRSSSVTYGQYSSTIMSYEILEGTSIVACYGYNNTPYSQWGK